MISRRDREVRTARFWTDTSPAKHVYVIYLPQFLSSSHMLQLPLLLQTRKFGMWVPSLQGNEAKVPNESFPKTKLNIYNIPLEELQTVNLHAKIFSRNNQYV